MNVVVFLAGTFTLPVAFVIGVRWATGRPPFD
jgi:hypothetical protein